MSFLYLTSDLVGTPSGGGIVTRQESEALKALGPTEVWDRAFLGENLPDPWGWDSVALARPKVPAPALCHVYAGTFSDTVRLLREGGVKVSYTCAAHDRHVSRKEHEALGIPYAQYYPHMVEQDLFERYSRGYFEADVLIVPSKHSHDVMRAEGAKNRIEIIPHGVHLPKRTTPVRSDLFVVGNLGAVTGPDKGNRYLLEAWKRLNYPADEACLVFGGRTSQTEIMMNLCRHFGGVENWEVKPSSEANKTVLVGTNRDGRGKVLLLGWLDDVRVFYDAISLYVQPSVSEGFGIEVLEAMSYGRPILCSSGAGAWDVVGHLGQSFVAGNVGDLVDSIVRIRGQDLSWYGRHNRDASCKYSWDNVRLVYQSVWRSLL